MQLSHSNQSNVIASQGVQTSSSFNIARTPHMFNILSSGLYSDKIAAVLREISCNAMDAHIMGGVPDKPIQVKLPSLLDRTFHVKDWGPGLDDQEVRELYTTYGWSSKQQNNDVTGAFGLGSKSPFAYTMHNAESSDGFTIVSCKHGIKRIYTCHIGDDGAPAISRLFEGPADADWQHGVMVTFPVQEADIREFHHKARQVFRWFKVEPELLGLDAPMEKPSYRFSGERFALPRLGDQSLDVPAVVTGNVRYPISPGRLGDVGPLEKALLDANVQLFLPIGQVLMTPSREELQYTEQTKRSIRTALASIADEMGQRLSEDVRNVDLTRWEWYKRLHEYTDGLPYSIRHQLDELLKLAGVPDDERALIKSALDEKGASLPSWAGDGVDGPASWFQLDESGRRKRTADGKGWELVEGPRNGARLWVYQSHSNRQGVVQRREIVRGLLTARNREPLKAVLGFKAKVQVFYTDAPHADARVREAVRAGEVELALFVSPMPGSEEGYAQAYAQRLASLEGIEGLPVVGVSTLAVPDSVAEARERNRRAKLEGPLAKLKDEEVMFMAMDGTPSIKLLGDLAGDEQYYITCTNPDNVRSATFRSFGPQGEHTSLSFSGYWRQEVLSAAAVVAKKLGETIDGVVVVRSEAAARRLKFAELGFKSLLPDLRERILANKQVFQEGQPDLDRMPRIRFEYAYYADDWGLMGYLGHLLKHDAAFKKEFDKRLGGSPLERSVQKLLRECPHERKESKPAETLLAVQMLRQRVCHSMAPATEVQVSEMSQQEFFQQVRKWNPMLGLVSVNTFRNLAENKDTRAEALDLLVQLAELTGIGQAGTAPMLELKA